MLLRLVLFKMMQNTFGVLCRRCLVTVVMEPESFVLVDGVIGQAVCPVLWLFRFRQGTSLERLGLLLFIFYSTGVGPGLLLLVLCFSTGVGSGGFVLYPCLCRDLFLICLVGYCLFGGNHFFDVGGSHGTGNRPWEPVRSSMGLVIDSRGLLPTRLGEDDDGRSLRMGALLWPHLMKHVGEACGCESHFSRSSLETAVSVARPCVVK